MNFAVYLFPVYQRDSLLGHGVDRLMQQPEYPADYSN